MYSVKQVSDMSGRTERHLWRLIASGKLPHTKDGDGRVWIAPEHVPARRALDPASVAAILTRLDELEQRVAELEQPRARVHSGVGAASRREVSQGPRLVGGLPGQSGLPSSQRGRARWVELHGGARETGARMWSELTAWSSVGEAIEGIRRRGYSPRPCATSACECHQVLAE